MAPPLRISCGQPCPASSGSSSNTEAKAMLPDDEVPGSLQNQVPADAVVGEPNLVEEKLHDEESRLQTCWTAAMEKEMGVPHGYQNAAVLLIRWCDELDELKCGDEVEELEKLFSRPTGFNFNTVRLELDNKRNPETQLKGALYSFVNTYDGPHNLLIVYYSGHGVAYDGGGPDTLKFHASNTHDLKYEKPFPAVVSWKDIQDILIESSVQSNIFAILDTCFAGNLIKGPMTEETKIFEVLAAAGPNKVTSGPGPRSFTRALMNSLEKLLQTCGDHGQFNSWELHNNIISTATRRNNPPVLFPVIRQFNRHLPLSPLRDSEGERADSFRKLDAKAFLTLRFALQDKRLTEDHVKDLVKYLAVGARDSGVKIQSIDWLALRYSPRLRPTVLGIRAMVAWKKAIQVATALRSPVRTNSAASFKMMMEGGVGGPPILQKRGSAEMGGHHDEDDEGEGMEGVVGLLEPNVKRARVEEGALTEVLLTPGETGSEVSSDLDG